jgi:hypothetical protein
LKCGKVWEREDFKTVVRHADRCTGTLMEVEEGAPVVAFSCPGCDQWVPMLKLAVLAAHLCSCLQRVVRDRAPVDGPGVGGGPVLARAAPVPPRAQQDFIVALKTASVEWVSVVEGARFFVDNSLTWGFPARSGEQQADILRVFRVLLDRLGVWEPLPWTPFDDEGEQSREDYDEEGGIPPFTRPISEAEFNTIRLTVQAFLRGRDTHHDAGRGPKASKRPAASTFDSDTSSSGGEGDRDGGGKSDEFVRRKAVRVSDTYFGVAGELVSLVGTQEAALVFGRWPTGTAFGAVPLPRKVCYTYKNVHPPVEYALGGYMAGVLDLRFMACDSAMESVYSHYGGWGVWAILLW